jgi:SAM-dependent methyltransferase
MLTVDYDRLGVRPGDLLLDLGCGGGRHAFEAYRRGAHVVAYDRDRLEIKNATAILGGMEDAGEAPVGTVGAAAIGDALELPFPDGAFDRVIAAEILEHITDDRAAIAELARVLRPGGTIGVTVPRWFPEQVCWALDDDYHAPLAPGGHLRVYRHRQLVGRLRDAGLEPRGGHHAHALHAPYWWLKCAVGVRNDDALLPRLYHRFLVWDMTARTPPVRLLERALNPVLGKSAVLYLQKPDLEGTP